MASWLRYEQVRDSLRTGDVVLFSGTSITSLALRIVQRSRWSHVGMVVRIPDMDCVCVWESTSLGGRDVVTGKPLVGVGISALSERLRDYAGTIALRRYRPPDGQEITPESFGRVRRALHGRPYEESFTALAGAALDGTILDRIDDRASADLSSVFCSELVAETFRRLGLLVGDLPSDEYTPADFGGRVEGLLGELGEIVEVRL